VVYQYLADRWIGRRRQVEQVAIDAIDGKTPAVVVTGGSRGIGLAIAIRFALAGRTVALVARDAGQLAAAVESVQERTGQAALAIRCDITDPAAAQIIEARLGEHNCYLEILVNNAGAGIGGEFILQDPASIANVVDLNVQAPTRLTRHVLPGMLDRGRGGIINVSSLGGLMPGPYQSAYYASKAYVISLTRALAHEVRGRGVRISCVAPGPVRTEFHEALDSDHRALYRYLLPWMSPESVAASIYRGYRLGHAVIVPGVVNAGLYRIVGFLPYQLIVPLVGLLLYPGPNGAQQDGARHDKVRKRKA